MRLPRVLEVDVNAVDSGSRLPVLLFDRGDDQGGIAFAEDQSDRALGGKVMKAGQIGNPPGVEYDQRIKSGRLEPSANGLRPMPVLGRRDGWWSAQ